MFNPALQSSTSMEQVILCHIFNLFEIEGGDKETLP